MERIWTEKAWTEKAWTEKVWIEKIWIENVWIEKNWLAGALLPALTRHARKSKTLPGFKIDFGSKVFLIERIKAISVGERE